MRTLAASVFGRLCLVTLLALGGGLGCRVLEGNLPQRATGPLLPGQTADVYTTARPTLAAAVSDFFGRRPVEVPQSFDFPHSIHVEHKIPCAEYCHESVSMGPVAGLPSVRTCMTCHRTQATDRPRIMQITAMFNSGRDITWNRVFGYPATAHVRFNHAPHIRANLECATCHGNVAGQSVAQRNVDLTMGFCVNCHRERQAPDDCLTCHY